VEPQQRNTALMVGAGVALGVLGWELLRRRRESD
jgi:hypothetical protein